MAAAEVTVVRADGDRVQRGDVVLTVTGRTRSLLVCERTALNLLCHLSGVATATAAWADALSGTRARVRDTRKTTPGLRALEKYAVRCGGGVNHRMGLWDAALVKDNHVVAAGGVAQAFEAVRTRFPGVPVEVEVDSLEQLAEVVDAGADLVLLDNFSPAQTADAVALVAGRCQLESSGGLSLHVAAAYAATGVDFLAVGALTHSAPVLDMGADLRPVESGLWSAQGGLTHAPDRRRRQHQHRPRVVRGPRAGALLADHDPRPGHRRRDGPDLPGPAHGGPRGHRDRPVLDGARRSCARCARCSTATGTTSPR